jgi:hypothetical protein
MNISSLVSRLFFGLAFALLLVAIFEKLANLTGYTILRGFDPGRLLDYATVLLVFVIAILVRQIRDASVRT